MVKVRVRSLKGARQTVCLGFTKNYPIGVRPWARVRVMARVRVVARVRVLARVRAVLRGSRD